MPSPSHCPARRFLAAAVVAGTAALLGACSLTFNWREVPIDEDGLIALLPCKPERATRAMPLGQEAVSVDMAGCEAGGATFAVARASAGNADQAESWMRAWRAATRAQLAGVRSVEAAATVPRAALSPAPGRLDTPADAADTKATMHVLWFAHRGRTGVALYQATVLGRPSSADAVSTFFEGLRLP